MKPDWKVLILCFFYLTQLDVSPYLFAQSDENQNRAWSIGTAFLLPQGQWEVGVFHPLRYGFSGTLEFEVHPLLFFVMPNAGVKWRHHSILNTTISTRHTLLYPTPLLRLMSRKGSGGIISPEFTIPHMFELYNELLTSKSVFHIHTLTLKAGISLAVKSNLLDERTSIDLPLVYNRLAVFYHGYGFRFGVDFEGPIGKDFKYVIDADYFYIPKVNFNNAFETKTLFYWQLSDRSQICLGAKLVYGEYPFGNQWHLLLPLIDFQYSWK